MSRLPLRSMLGLALLLWFVRWAAGEAAAYVGHHPRQPGLDPLESTHPPGWMQGPSNYGPERGMEEG